MTKFTFFDYLRRYNIQKYPAAATEFDSMPDNSIPLYRGTEMLNNPDRGFRGELKITLGTMEEYPNTELSAYDALDIHYKKYRKENINYYQLYVYLTRYSKKHIDREAIEQLTAYMKKLKELNIRVLLRFAYETELTKECPTTKHIIENIHILKKWFDENKSLINETVYAMQLGMIGLWGEGHSSSRYINKRKIISSVFDMIPDDMTLTMRHPKYLSLVPKEYKKRASLHDDFIIGFEHPWGTIPFNHKDWQPLINKCKHSFTDAEMPWGRDKTITDINPFDFLCQCRDYGLSTLSIEHNYKEDGNRYHLMKWKDIYITEKELKKRKLPYLPVSLEDEKISVFDYLNNHLGLVPCIGNLNRTADSVEFDFYNFGLGTAVDYRIIAKTENKEFTLCDDMSDICQFSRTHFQIPNCKNLQLRIERKNVPTLTYRLANKIDFVDGWNKIF